MAKLPAISGIQAVRAFSRVGFEHDRTKGDHAILVKPEYRIHLSVPLHRELKSGTLRRLIRDAGLTVDDFALLLE